MTNELILFVDNNARFLEVRKQFLIRAGYRIVVTDNYEDTKTALETRRFDLAILDMRLMDDMQDDDFSGIQLARTCAPDIPKIILTGFPTWESVRNALEWRSDGTTPAIEILAKQEGAEALLRSVDWILHKRELWHNIVKSFGVPTLMAMPDQVASLGIDESGRRLHESLSCTAEQWLTLRTAEMKHAGHLHTVGLAAALISSALVFSSVILALLGKVSLPLLPVILGGLGQAASTIFFVREDKSNTRVQECTTKLDELYKIENLLVVCDSLEDKQARQEFRRKVIEKLLDEWF